MPYQEDGRLQEVDCYVPGVSDQFETKGVFGYDAQGRIRSLSYTDGAGAALDNYAWTYDAGNIHSVTNKFDGTTTYAYLCPCQLAVGDFPPARDARPAKLTRLLRLEVGREARNTEKRVGGAGGGASSPCSSARCGRNRMTQQQSKGNLWQHAANARLTLSA